jgi:thiamine pyrophosphokinase
MSELVAGWLQHQDLCVAVDGGVRHLRFLSILPNLVIGDGDSLSEKDDAYIEDNRVTREQYSPHKDASDFELCLKHPFIKDKKHIQVVGGLGGRLDHTLCNLHCASNFLRSAWVQFYDGESLVTLIPPKQTLKIDAAYGSTVTLLPLLSPALGVYFDGVRWPIEGKEITPGSSLTLSNELLTDDSTLRYEQGSLALFQWNAR